MLPPHAEMVRAMLERDTVYGGGQPRKAFLLRLEKTAVQVTQPLAF
jgi:hypothetical protein